MQEKQLLIFLINILQENLKLGFKRTGLKILTPEQMLERMPIALAQIKAGYNSENLLNELGHFVSIKRN